MITYVSGNLFESPAKVLVNTVNTEGVMGKGIALEFKRIYPEMFQEYRTLCERGKLAIGTLHLFKTPHKWILNFPTKKTWRQPSRVEYIEAGLRSFLKGYAEAGISSIAMPPLGCGNGQLDYESQVKPLIEKYLGKLPLPIFVYQHRPLSTPAEHRNVEEISKWLRSEPESLPFDEVWSELADIVNQRRLFRTPTTQSEFEAHANEVPPSLVVESSSKTFKIEHDQLLNFWQQLRDFGFTYKSIAQEHRLVSYLMPIFEELSYVHRVAVSDTTDGLKKKAEVALQVIPPSRPVEQSIGDLFVPRANGK